MKLNSKSFALTCGLVWGFGLLFITWWLIVFEGPADTAAKGDAPPFIGLTYRGYHFTYLGSVIGLAWAFADGLIGGAVFAWLYNALCGKKAEA